MSNAVVRARINAQTKVEAEAVLASIGLTVSDAIRLMLVRIATEKAMPFEPLVPNSKTVAAMREARKAGLKRYPDSKTMLKALNADD
jgi:DNA-damage-inducible protein J